MLRVVPVTQATAKAFVSALHRHHRPSLGAVFCVGVADATRLRGVAMVGRPVARKLDDGFTLEITRVATDGARNACSMLYGACRRAAWALGYCRILTYTLPEEGGVSLRASGWTCEATTPGKAWKRTDGAKRANLHPLGLKLRWECRRGEPGAAPTVPSMGEDHPSLFGLAAGMDEA